ncbi:hypothetical protein BGM26_07555 [Bacillus sp. FJAT-29790]|uniref:hypothetical protein n=1 Tax=Bacillus sp. FJAT-29790 TaxID=1895002 RepID=UPI001C231CBC|nr:hypothetical protein [Bacillus sp. FJAT-29790]MBU8878841.1 hypothetical protein [Bacillus sp. FJAT-29790]
MEQVKIYKISLYPILALMFTGGIMFFSFCFMSLTDILLNIFISFVGLFFSFVFLGYSFYLLRKRREGKGFYWDDEGIVIDLHGNKVYWDEIESIQYSDVRGMKSTVIYPHYTNHEKIRIRRKKWMPTTAHSIDWFYIEKPKELHKNLMKTWEEKKH